MSNVLGSLVVELNANTAKFTEALGKAASTAHQRLRGINAIKLRVSSANIT